MTGTVSGAQLRAFIERIERLEEEKRTIADDIKEVKAEAKGCGFDLQTINAILKLRKKDAAERDEEQAMLDLYMSALGMLPLFEEPAASYSEQKGRGVDAAFVNSILVGGELTDNQESVGTVAAGTSAVSPASDESETDDVGATASSTNPNSQRPLAVKSAGEAGSSSPLTSPATNPDDDIPTFLRRDLVEA